MSKLRNQTRSVYGHGLALTMIGVLTTAACAGDPADELETACAEGARDEAAALSCQLGQPVNTDGVAAEELVLDREADAAARAAWTHCEIFTGPCTGPFGGCTEVRVGWWTFRVCGPNIQPWVRVCERWPAPPVPVEWGVNACSR